MRYHLLILFAILSLNLITSQKKSTPDNRLAGIDAKLEALLAEWKVAGFAVAVVEKDKVVYAKGFGYRDLENKKTVTPNTLIQNITNRTHVSYFNNIGIDLLMERLFTTTI